MTEQSIKELSLALLEATVKIAERDEKIEALEEVLRLKELELSKQWINCKDSPVNHTTDWKDGDLALALTNDGHVIEINYDDGVWCSMTGDDFEYWMPMPKYPEEMVSKG